MNTTVIIAVVCVLGGSVLLAIPFMLLSKKRKGGEAQFAERNRDKAIVHLYCRKTLIDDADIAYLNPVKGQYGQKIVALAPGRHTFEGIFETSDISLGKNVNLKSGKLRFDITLEAGQTYTLSVYLYSPEQRKTYYKGDVGEDVFSLALDIEGRGESSKAYVICYRES
ncbi:hypothetical protein LJC32_06715 [Oscillospiraceae bacterium OttesenSCG-928-F05]|nr:hypothetical protein [Oscillospiraceae bacterium OttesenSCG-928-F05]